LLKNAAASDASDKVIDTNHDVSAISDERQASALIEQTQGPITLRIGLGSQFRSPAGPSYSPAMAEQASLSPPSLCSPMSGDLVCTRECRIFDNH
jgi:hypothetical protein